MKDKHVAGLLALFLGAFGVHKFYLGQVVLGFIYLLFFWTGVPMVLGWIEALILFFGSKSRFNKRFN